MAYDPEITEQIRRWLETPAEDRDVPAGALLLLRLNRNRVLYSNIMARPGQLMPKLEYELKQFLLIRTDNMTREGIIEMESRVMPEVRSIIDAGASKELLEGEGKEVTHWGRREDHDTLPEEIRRLFDASAERYRVIRSLYYSLKAMDRMQPCDRYEKLKLLAEAEEKDRKAFARYDSYSVQEGSGSAGSAADVKAVNAARKFVSEHRELLAGMEPGQKREELLAQMQEKVDLVLASGGKFSEEHSGRLRGLGIDI